jgi:hypothetical protein
MEKVKTAKKLFMTINEQLERALDGPVGLKQSTLSNLKMVNEELADAFIDNLKKLERYERGEVK